MPHTPRPVVHLSATARLCVCGQAPGARVHASGVPFSDPSGDRLRRWMGIDAAAFYDKRRLAIVPMGFCFPGHDSKGGDLPPRRECVRLWHDQIFAAMPQITLILAIGQYAQAYHLKKRRQPTLTQTVKQWRTYARGAGDCDPAVLPLPHPSWRNNGWLKRHTWFECDVLPFLRQRVQELM